MLKLLPLVLLATIAVPATAGAVTVRDIIELTRAGLPDEVLVAVIDADRTIFTLDKDQILELKKAGVSQAVLLKMLRSRREFEPPPESATAPQEVAPQVVIIGADPPRPPAPRAPRGYYEVVMPYYFVPVPIWGHPVHRPSPVAPAPFLAPEHRGFGRFINDGWIGRP